MLQNCSKTVQKIGNLKKQPLNRIRICFYGTNWQQNNFGMHYDGTWSSDDTWKLCDIEVEYKDKIGLKENKFIIVLGPILNGIG